MRRWGNLSLRISGRQVPLGTSPMDVPNGIATGDKPLKKNLEVLVRIEIDIDTENRIFINGVEWWPSHAIGGGVTEEESRPFQIGDFVRVVRDTIDCLDRPSLAGKTGRVVHLANHQELPIGVEFPKDIGGHSCARQTTYGHGWYFAPRHLEYID